MNTTLDNLFLELCNKYSKEESNQDTPINILSDIRLEKKYSKLTVQEKALLAKMTISAVDSAETAKIIEEEMIEDYGAFANYFYK